MGRNKKNGLDYFPFDIDTFQDIRIRKLIKYQSGKAVTVYALLLCLIYKGGYYMRWDEELPFIISEQTGFEEAYIQEVIKSCMVLGLFSKELFDTKRVLTSKGIQERYRNICKQINRKCDFSEFSLISSEKNTISSEEMPVSSEEMPINSEKIPQKKIKEKKINKEILSKESTKKVYDLEFADEPFKGIFKTWLDYKSERKEYYKTEQTLKTCYKQLLRLSNNNPDMAELVVEQSIARQWQGLFELKDKANIFLKKNENTLYNTSEGNYKRFVERVKADMPYCFANMRIPSEKDFEELKKHVGSSAKILEAMRQVENNVSLREKRECLLQTIKDQIEYNERHGTS